MLMQNIEKLLDKALNEGYLSQKEGLILYLEASLPSLMAVAHMIRQQRVPGDKVGWQIDRNVNITNICFSQCKFCNFCRKPSDNDTYITSIEEYEKKIEELFSFGGDQLLLQGGMHPKLGLEYYEDLFRTLKNRFPGLKLHALGPPEIVHLSNLSSLDYSTVLRRLVAAGLDSLPGAGGEILVDRVRKIVSPAKASSNEWLSVMEEAHKMNLPTSATMMYGHIETPEERIEHLIRIRELQSLKPDRHYGFISFIPWPFMDKGTVLADKQGVKSTVGMSDYIRLIAICRIMLDNITNIQASILTTGENTAQMTLQAGANDLGSVMIEENVVSAAGSSGMFNADQLKQTIRKAGFTPQLRNQKYEPLNEA
jgi:cyclic dehypoxanthinyl futalosine synthase